MAKWTRFLVGGAVRDMLSGRAAKDRDWVVVGATDEDMRRAGFQRVGAEFPVYLHPETREEHALARTERKTGAGYKGFATITDGVSLADDLARRDLTINAIAMADDGTVIDPFNGRSDLAAGILRHVGPAFREDPVRVLRVARFSARLAFAVAPETMAMMRDMVAAGELRSLTGERIWLDTEKALATDDPDQFFSILDAVGALPDVFGATPDPGAGILAVSRAARMSRDPSIRVAAFAVGAGWNVATVKRLKAPAAVLAVATAAIAHAATLADGSDPDRLVRSLIAMRARHDLAMVRAVATVAVSVSGRGRAVGRSLRVAHAIRTVPVPTDVSGAAIGRAHHAAMVAVAQGIGG